MIFKETPLKGAFEIEMNKLGDERGFFARTFCVNEFKEHELNTNWVQCNMSMSKVKGTLRGMHYQINEAAETKLVRCTKGSILDVIIDVRPDSPTYLQHFKVELSEANHKMLYIPTGFAHGFLTMEDHIEIFYMVSNFYNKELERGIKWNDPKVGIDWGIEHPILSEKDENYPLL